MRWGYILFNKCPRSGERLRFGAKNGPHKLVSCRCGYFIDHSKFEELKRKISIDRGRVPLPTPKA